MKFVWLRNLFRRKKSGQVAKDRLKILLISDRVDCSPEVMEMIKTDIARVISKYMKIDSEHMSIQINKRGNAQSRMNKPFLYANIPILDIAGRSGSES